MGDTKLFRKNSARYKSKLRPYHQRVTIPKEIWAYIQERQLQEFQSVTLKGGAGTHMMDTGVETVCEIEIHADSKQSLSKALKAVLTLTCGVIIRKFKGVKSSDDVWSDYPEILVLDNGEGLLVVGPEQEVLAMDRILHPPERDQQASSWSPVKPKRSDPTPPLSSNSLTNGQSPPISPARGPPSPSVTPATFLAERGQRIHVRREDITRMRVDVIVNAANEHLRHEGGVALAISQTAGPELQRECDLYTQGYGYLHVTQVTVTKGYNLPARHVIHVVGPRWQETSRRECSENLYVAIMNCLNLAARLNVSSIAIPAISSGIYGAPPEMATQQMCRAVLDFCRTESSITNIYLVDINDDIPEMIARQLQKSGKVNMETDLPRSQFQPPQRGYPAQAQWNNGVGQSPTNQSQAAASYNGQNYAKTTKPEVNIQSQRQGVPMTRGVPPFTQTNGPPPAEYRNVPRAPTTNYRGEEDVFSPVKNTYQFQFANGFHPGPKSDARIGQAPREGQMCHPEPGLAQYSRPPQPQHQADPRYNAATDDVNYNPGRERARPGGNCGICKDALTAPLTLPCGHVFCRDCIRPRLKEKTTCPCCGQVIGSPTGNQPDGTMEHKMIRMSLPGYKGFGTLEIIYNLPNGIQQTNHPRPGYPYSGTNHRAYLPNTPEGREVLALLRKAFDARLLFTIGRSVTTGQENQVTWNGVRHKTSMTGGPQCSGYPDPTYLPKVKADLAAMGIQ